MIYRTLREIRVIDPSLRTLRFNRRLEDAGWAPGPIDDDAPTGAAVVWGLACAVIVALIVAVLL